MNLRTLAFAAAALIGCSQADAQFSSSIKMVKKHHLVGEAVMVRVTLTNYSGEDQILHGSRMPWISFIVKTSNGNPVHGRQVAPAKPIKIAPGETLARDFNLSQYFQLGQAGNFSVSAVIRPPDPKLQGTSTNRALFELRNGRLYWSQKVGRPGSTSETREFRLLQFRNESHTELYAQIKDEQTGQMLNTFSLGQTLMMRKPSATIDSQQHLHVLFLSTPTIWLHYRIAPNGRIVLSDMHRRAPVGDPKLTALPNGAVEVANSIHHDPVAIAKQRDAIQKITDRPEGWE